MTINFTKTWPKSMGRKLSGKPTFFAEKILKTLVDGGVPGIEASLREFAGLPNHVTDVELFKHFNQFTPKKHTIRGGDRWNAGQVIHFKQWTGEPYNSKTYNFAPLVRCVSAERVRIRWGEEHGIKTMLVDIEKHNLGRVDWKREGWVQFHEDGTTTDWGIMHDLAINDGFDNIEDFAKWFDHDFTGQIIHWTNTRY